MELEAKDNKIPLSLSSYSYNKTMHATMQLTPFPGACQLIDYGDVTV